MGKLKIGWSEISITPDKRISQAIVSAWQNRKPARYAAGFGRAAVGMCRRVCYSDGSAKMWGDTNTASLTELEGGEMLVRKTTEEINRLFAAD